MHFDLQAPGNTHLDQKRSEYRTADANYDKGAAIVPNYHAEL